MGAKRRTSQAITSITSLLSALIVATAFSNILSGHRSVISGDETLHFGLERTGAEIQKPRKLINEDRRKAGAVTEGGESSVEESVSSNSTTFSPPNGTISEQTIPRLPNVLLIGAQKGGSSALSQWLFGHGVCRPRTFPGEPDYWSKEVHLFDKEDRFRKGSIFYARRFQHCYPQNLTLPKVLAMDATPNYPPYARKVRRMYEAAGGGQAEALKIIISLREPVSRELSLYNHKTHEARKNSDNFPFWRGVVDYDMSERTKQIELLSFGKFVEQNTIPSVNTTDGSCTFRGHVNQCLSLYAYFLERWMRLFNHDQILVVSFDELKNDQARVMWRIRQFLGLDDQSGPGEVPSSNTQHSEHKIALPSCATQSKLAGTFEKANENLYALLASKIGPAMEQTPFPKFVLSNCTSDPVAVK